MPTSKTRALPTRRLFLAVWAIGCMAVVAPVRAHADPQQATEMVKRFGDQLVAVVNGPGTYPAKQQQLRPIIDSAVDVNGIARFCLGRFWNTATPAQQQQFINLFHEVLIRNITGHLGEFTGVSFTLGQTQERGDQDFVSSVVRRPNSAAANVQWVVDSTGGSPKVVDVIAEGTSLRLTQRSDYASYLSSHGQNLDALLTALQRQAAG